MQHPATGHPPGPEQDPNRSGPHSGLEWVRKRYPSLSWLPDDAHVEVASRGTPLWIAVAVWLGAPALFAFMAAPASGAGPAVAFGLLLLAVGALPSAANYRMTPNWFAIGNGTLVAKPVGAWSPTIVSLSNVQSVAGAPWWAGLNERRRFGRDPGHTWLRVRYGDSRRSSLVLATAYPDRVTTKLTALRTPTRR